MMKDIQHAAILELRQILTQKIIPRISSPESVRIILAQRPLRLPSGITVKRRPAPSLKINSNNRSNLLLSQYPEEGVHAIRYPYLCYVVDGQIDMCLGLAEERGKMRGTVNRYDIVTLPGHSALLMPPGVFYPDENHTGTSANVQVFWVLTLPSGVFCHASTVRNGVYASDHLDVFVPGQHFATLIDILEGDLRSADKEAAIVTRSLLLSFFSRILWKLNKGTQALLASRVQDNERGDVHLGNKSLTIQRACEFIRKHNGIAFTVDEVATYAYVSPSHLMRLFRTELQTTVMDYVLQQRFAVAEAWLKNSEMPIKQIASALGYSHAPQFNRIFKQIHGISPTEFRRQRGS